MTNIVPPNLDKLLKEFSTDDEGKGFVSWRGLARMSGVTHKTFGKGGNHFTLEIDQYLADGGFSLGTVKSDCSIPDLIAAEVIGFYAEEKQNPVAKKSSRIFRAIGLRTLIQQSTGYKPNPKRKLTAEEIIEVCCLPVPTTWERRFPEEYYSHLSRLTGLIVDGHTRPAYWAALTKQLVYDYLPEGIYSEIKRCKDESGSWDKLHQYLSSDGIEILQSHQKKVLHHMQGAATMLQLKTSLKQACTGEYQLVLL
jgi:P63C domain